MFAHFVIARGVSLDFLRGKPEINHFLENVMARDARDISRLVAEIRSFIAEGWPSPAEIKNFKRRMRTSTLIGLAATLLGILGLASTLAVYASVFLFATWYVDWHFEWIRPLSAACAFYAGYSLYETQPCEFTTHLGRNWKLPRGYAQSIRKSRHSGLSIFIPSGGLVFWGSVIGAFILYTLSEPYPAVVLLVAGVCVQNLIADSMTSRFAQPKDRIALSAGRALAAIPLTRQSLTVVTPTTLLKATNNAISFAYSGFEIAFIMATVLASPAILIIGPGGNGFWCWIFGPALAGFATLALLSAAGRLHKIWLIETKGLTASGSWVYHWFDISKKEKIRNVSAYYDPIMSEDEKLAFALFADDERAHVWALRRRMRVSRAWLRSWFTPRDYAFVSYAWAAEAKMKTAEKVGSACALAGVDFFIDSKGIDSRFGMFRIFLTRAIARATHVFFIFTPEVLAGRVVQGEIEIALHRWWDESSPAIICVVEPDVAESLRANPEVPVNLRYLLNFCPQLSFEEAAQPAIVHYLVALTRRPGRMWDWLFLLSPSAAKSRAFSLDGVIEHDAYVETQSHAQPSQVSN